MWTWVSESRDLSIYQDLFLFLRLTYGKLWNVESQRNEYTGKLYDIYKWRNVLSRFQIYSAAFYFPMHNWLTDWLGQKHTILLKRWWESAEKEALSGSEEKSPEKSPFFFPSQQYLYNHHVTPASSITNLLLEEVNAYKRPRWKLRFWTDWKTI